MARQFHDWYLGEYAYEYPELSHLDSIRVFILKASVDLDDFIYGEIVELRLSDRDKEPGYTALSYTWGENQYIHGIRVGNYQLRIGQNLNLALYNLRRQDRPVRLWVDALCINQNNVNERNHQVHQMQRIYSSALETVIYRGDMDGGNTGLSAWNFRERHATWAMDENGDPDPDLPVSKQNLIYFRGELSDVEIDVLAALVLPALGSPRGCCLKDVVDQMRTPKDFLG